MLRIACLLMILLSQPALAGRCLVNDVSNRVICCDAGEQAVFYPLGNRVICMASESLESCLFHPIASRIVCCESSQEALWYDIGSRVICCDQDLEQGVCESK